MTIHVRPPVIQGHLHFLLAAEVRERAEWQKEVVENRLWKWGKPSSVELRPPAVSVRCADTESHLLGLKATHLERRACRSWSQMNPAGCPWVSLVLFSELDILSSWTQKAVTGVSQSHHSLSGVVLRMGLASSHLWAPCTNWVFAMGHFLTQSHTVAGLSQAITLGWLLIALVLVPHFGSSVSTQLLELVTDLRTDQGSPGCAVWISAFFFTNEVEPSPEHSKIIDFWQLLLDRIKGFTLRSWK